MCVCLARSADVVVIKLKNVHFTACGNQQELLFYCTKAAGNRVGKLDNKAARQHRLCTPIKHTLLVPQRITLLLWAEEIGCLYKKLSNSVQS